MKHLVRAATLVLIAVGASAQTRANIWTQLGNTGTVDEADAGLHLFHPTGSVSIKTGVSSATLDLRYSMPVKGDYGTHVSPDDPTWEGPTPCVQLRARLRDSGAGSRVIVELKELDIFTGDRRTLGRIDSDAGGVPGTDYATYTECMAIPTDVPFDFANHAYYIEAQLIKTTSSANPGLMMVGVCGALACEEF